MTLELFPMVIIPVRVVFLYTAKASEELYRANGNNYKYSAAEI